MMITVDEQTLKRARMRALEEDTSVKALLREYLESYAGSKRERREAWESVLELASKLGMSSEGKELPKREELYDRKVLRNREHGE